MKAIQAIFVTLLFFLSGCGVVTLRETRGLGPLSRDSHVVEASADSLPNLSEPRWYVKRGQAPDPKNAITLGVQSHSFRIVSFEAYGPKGKVVPFSSIYRTSDDKAWRERSSYESWAPTEKISGAHTAELDHGSYRITIRYVLDGKEYDASWSFIYESTREIRRARFPTIN